MVTRTSARAENRDLTIISRLRLRHLAVLIAVAETRSMKRAATEVHLSQPGVTKLVQEAEEMLGLTLFERGARGVTLTPAGEVLLLRARVALGDLASARREAAQVAAGAVGRVTIGLLSVYETELLPRALLALRGEAPGLRIVVEEGVRAVLIDGLRRRSIDLVIGRHSLADAMPGLAFEPLVEHPICIVCGRHHPLADAATVDLAALAAAEWVLPLQETHARLVLEASFRRAGLPIPSATIESASVVINGTLLTRAPLLTLLPWGAAKPLAAIGLIRILPIALPEPAPPLALLMRDEPPSRAVGIVLDALRRASGEVGPPTLV
jgi:DNA-binding transcriptional LysR family regulator